MEVTDDELIRASHIVESSLLPAFSDINDDGFYETTQLLESSLLASTSTDFATPVNDSGRFR